jgi:hypothetical protein
VPRDGGWENVQMSATIFVQYFADLWQWFNVLLFISWLFNDSVSIETTWHP